MAAEIGGRMKVTEQIDALRSMGVSPTGYVVVPRFVAIMISMPLLIAEAMSLWNYFRNNGILPNSR